MRGLAVLTAAGAAWIIAGGSFPTLDRLGLRINPRRMLLAAGVGVVVFLVAFAVLGTVVPALAFGLIGGTVPIQVASAKERSGRTRAASSWPDLLAHIRSSVASGQTLADAYVAAAQRVGSPFTDTLEEVRRLLIFGEGFGAAMALVRESANDPSADRVTMTLVVANETGGNRVGDVLAALSSSVASETRLRQAHEAAMTEQRWTAGVALAAPWVILALSIATNPQSSAAFGTLEGALVVTVGLAMTVAGWLLARHAAKLSETPRMFK
jgi:tight adherence protein B